MLEVRATAIVGASAHIARIRTAIQMWKVPVEPPTDLSAKLEAKTCTTIASSFSKIAIASEALSAPVTKIAADRAARALRKRSARPNFEELDQMAREVSSRLNDELSGTKFYCIKPGAASFYDPAEALFGKQVEARISKANDDISEAGKCFAVDRFTAAVFHLMRAMEAAVQKISQELGVENTDREWGKLLSDIHAKIEAMPKGDKRNDWSQVHANLYHVKQAWRNDTMHPKATYTEEEAREVFDAMRAFMRHLASLLPPDAAELIG
jgi:HEPN domain-containing protein